MFLFLFLFLSHPHFLSTSARKKRLKTNTLRLQRPIKTRSCQVARLDMGEGAPQVAQSDGTMLDAQERARQNRPGCRLSFSKREVAQARASLMLAMDMAVVIIHGQVAVAMALIMSLAHNNTTCTVIAHGTVLHPRFHLCTHSKRRRARPPLRKDKGADLASSRPFVRGQTLFPPSSNKKTCTCCNL